MTSSYGQRSYRGSHVFQSDVSCHGNYEYENFVISYPPPFFFYILVIVEKKRHSDNDYSEILDLGDELDLRLRK